MAHRTLWYDNEHRCDKSCPHLDGGYCKLYDKALQIRQSSAGNMVYRKCGKCRHKGGKRK